MLQELRDKSTGMVAKIIIGFIIVIFALFGTEALFERSANASGTISVNGEKITETDIERGIQNRKQQMISRFGDSVPPDFLTDEKLRQPVVELFFSRRDCRQVAARQEHVDRKRHHRGIGREAQPGDGVFHDPDKIRPRQRDGGNAQ